MMMILCKLQPN